MSRLSRSLSVALGLALLGGSRVHADDLHRYSFTIAGPGGRDGPHDHAREVVPARPDFSLWVDGKIARPHRFDFVFTVERTDGDRVEIHENGDRRIRGWVAARDVVPLDQAESFFSARIQADGRGAFPYLMRAVVRYHLKQTDAALADLNEAIRIDPRCTAALDRRAWIAMKQERRDPALADVERAIRIDPADPDLFFTRASYHKTFDKEKPELAIADLDREIQLDPSDPNAFLLRAISNRKRHRSRECLADINQAMALGGHDPDVFLNSILLLVDAGEYRKAREAMAARLGEHPDHDLAYQCKILKAIMDANRLMFPFAMHELRQAIALDPSKDEAYLFRSALRQEMGFPPWKVRQDLDAAIRTNPGHPQAYVIRSLFHEDRGDFGAALADLEAATRLAPEDAGLHERLAWLLATCPDAKVRNGPRAVASATRACELSGWKKADHLAVLAAAESEAGDFRAAVAYQENAIGLLEKNDFKGAEYRRSLGRYKAGKPIHRLSLLEEWGIRTAAQAAR